MIVIMRDAVMPECCNTCVCSEGYGCGITGTEMTTKEMEERPGWCPLEEVEPCEDVVSRASVEYICRKNTVSTNPYKHEHHDKFIEFMDDPEISDFGMWQRSNGFNTALVAVKCDLDEVPSVTPKPRMGKWIINSDGYYPYCSECKAEPKSGEMTDFCPRCGADMRGEQDE